MRTLLPLMLVLALSPDMVAAYIGPGAGISAFGSLLALAAALFLAIVGFLWYPLKRLLKYRSTASTKRNRTDEVS